MRVVLIVEQNGNVSDVQLVSSSGYDIFDQAAINTLKKWKLPSSNRRRRIPRLVTFGMKGSDLERQARERRERQQRQARDRQQRERERQARERQQREQELREQTLQPSNLEPLAPPEAPVKPSPVPVEPPFTPVEPSPLAPVDQITPPSAPGQ